MPPKRSVSLRASRAFAVSVASLALAPASGLAAKLVDVRVGDHDSHARVVFELDGAASYQVGGGSSELVLELAFDADAEPRKIDAAAGPITAIVIERGASGSLARIFLDGAARFESVQLVNPDRIVLDVFPTRSEPPAPSSPPPAVEFEPDPGLESELAATLEAPSAVLDLPSSGGFWPDGHRRSQVIDMRVDPQLTHARVVLDFDVPTGYSVETLKGADGPGWVVTVEATAEERTIQDAGDLLDSVWIEKGSPHTSVHIRARHADLALTEVLQSRPPRLVLEVRR